MQITVIKKNKLSIFMLPERIQGSHWITDFENGRKINLISIEGTKNGWQIVSNQDAFIMDNNELLVPYTILKEYSFYILKNNYKNEKYYLYCSPVYDKTYKELGMETGTKLIVGSGKNCDISYNLGGVPEKAFRLEKQEQYFILNILNGQATVYVNGKRVLESKRIEYGDIIFIFGLKIIPLRKDGHAYLLVNNPNDLLNYNASFVNVLPSKAEYVEDYAELTDDSMYKEVDFFYRTPHFYKTIDKFELNIDAPPSKKEEDGTPVVLTIGPMVTMAMTSVVMLMSTLSRVESKEATWSSAFPSIVMCGAMLASCLLWPLLTKTYQKFSDKMFERKRQRLYKKYIDKKEKEIENALVLQKNILLDNNFTVSDCQNVIKSHDVKLWQRRITDIDFLTLPIGIGNQPMQIEIKYPEEHFTLSEDNLLDIAHELGKKERILEHVPITYSFFQNIATGIVGDERTTKEFIDRFVLQVMANYSYDEVKIVTFTSTDNEKDWDYIKVLPHSWSNDGAIRYFGASNEDYSEIMYSLEKTYNERINTEKEIGRFMPHYIIITDAIKSIDSYDFIKDIMSNKINYGFSIIMLVDKVPALPNECKNFINVSRDKCTIFSSVLNSEVQEFKIDFSATDEIYNCAKELSNIPIDIKSEAESALPDTYEFLEMYQVGKVEQLNCSERWKKSNPILSLQVPIGIGKNGEIINLDLHEKYHGPHGLIAGTTGAGKSEFIVTYILSLAVNYHPEEVQIILIDYKGGSLAGAFSGASYQLPHIAGTITNLDGNELNRSLASIESEIKRRQQEFNKARIQASESTIDIYKYQKLYREGRLEGMEPISHLFIISDEFAELKEQQPEFMDKLISTARVGRSLGIHLILATQKPGGVVDPQIWSNTRFRVCLKVQDTSDSNEVLKKPDAAFLKKTGRFYLQVGYDEIFTLGQSAWAGGQYYPNPTFRKDVDTSINVINNIGFVTTTKDEKRVEKVESLGEELPNIVKYLSNLAVQEHINVRKLWLEKIPEKIYIDLLKQKYNFQKTPFYINPIVGEYDDPDSQNQYALALPLSDAGNAIIYGIAGSGKEMFLNAFLYSSMVSYTPEEINFYILDFGAETLKKYAKSPYVGDIAFISEEEKIENLFKMLEKELNRRKGEFSNYGGNYTSFISAGNHKMPNIVVIINNVEGLIETYEELIENLNTLSRESFKYGIFFILTASSENSIRLRTKQNFQLIYALGQNSETDFSSILGNVQGKVPAGLKGRGLFRKENVYEFQTASITTENENEFIKAFISKQVSGYSYRAKKIPVLPDVVDFKYVEKELTSPNVVIGVNKEKLEIEKYNFSKNAINLICSYELENMKDFIDTFVDQITYLNDYEIRFINSTEIAMANPNLNKKIFTKDFDTVIQNLSDYIDKVYKTYEQSNYSNEIIATQKKYMYIIYGVYGFINKLSDDNKNKLAKMMKQDNEMGLVSFVFIDNPDMLKSYSYEEWFKNGCDLTKGIWIGSGITEQSLIKIIKFDREDRLEISNEYGYIINNSKQSKIKLLLDFKIKKSSE